MKLLLNACHAVNLTDHRDRRELDSQSSYIASTTRRVVLMRSVKGFTLIELMVVVVLLGIFASLAVPSFNRMIEKNRVEAASSELYRLVLAARSDAVNKRSAATLSYTAAARTWQLSQGGATVRQFVVPASLGSSQTQNSLIFRPDGTVSAAATLKVSSDKTATEYAIGIQRSGSARMTGPTTLTTSEL
ncbi:MAG: GspH/FimT family pseudopilin [Halopseudomonas sp.]|uniref:GspH/FimT family pseudopilin n=1 Tax=Halopseudomonas sp. TaxID=2901191 RepID=UPI0030014DE1